MKKLLRLYELQVPGQLAFDRGFQARLTQQQDSTDNSSIGKSWNQFGRNGDRTRLISVPRYNWCAPLSHPSSSMLVQSGPSTTESMSKKTISHANEEYNCKHTLHLIQRPCYQRGSPCQDPAGNRTTRRPPDHCKETQTAVVWTCLPFIRSGQNHLARHSERGKKTRQTKEEVGRQHQGMDRPGVRQVPEGSGEQGKMEETGCEIICGAPTTGTSVSKMRFLTYLTSLP